VRALPIRSKKHVKYRLPNGAVFTMSKTPSDHRSVINELMILRRLVAGMVPQQG
jgi:hypothetical protein